MMNFCIQLKDLGVRLRDERDRIGISQDRCAELSGITRVSQSRYEVGRSAPGLEYLQRLGELGIDVHYVLFGRRGADCVFIENETLFGQAVEAVNEVMDRHNVRPPAVFRAQAVLRAHTLLARRGGAEALSLDDLLATEA